jgi:hypothetical protein
MADELLSRMDRARSRLDAMGMTNHYAYLSWTPEERFAFDVRKKQADEEFWSAYHAYHDAVRRAALPLSKDRRT